MAEKGRISVRLNEHQDNLERHNVLGKPPRSCNSEKLKEMHGWVTEPEDVLVPRGGWLEDFVTSKRGWETPTFYTMWAGLSIISGVLKRDAFLSWADSVLVPNLYMIFVGPPAVVKKSMTTGLISDFLIRWPIFLEAKEETRYKIRKKMVMIEGLSTIEKVFEDLGNPQDIVFKSHNGAKTELLSPGSAGLLIVPELTTVLSKEIKYAATLLTHLCDWYDCKEFGSVHKTKTDGDQQLRNVFFNFVGATTPAAVKSDLPKEALGGGFLSRTMFLYKENTKRKWAIPQLLAGCPTRDILQERMLWCMKNADGEFKLSPEAMAWYQDWYDRFGVALESGDDVYRDVHGRMPVNMLKLAILLRAQEYRLGRDIQIQHLTLAEELLENSLKSTMQFLGQIQTNPLFDLEQLLIGVLKKHREKTISELQLAFSKRMSPMILSTVIQSLYMQGMVSLVNRDTNIPVKEFDFNPKLKCVFNASMFQSRELITNETQDYTSVHDIEIDEENIHRAHPFTVKDAANHEFLMEQEESRTSAEVKPPSQ